jgi:hypothetical protein
MKAFVVVSLLILSLFSYAGPLPPDNLSGEELKVWLKKKLVFWKTSRFRL